MLFCFVLFLGKLNAFCAAALLLLCCGGCVELLSLSFCLN